MTSIAALLLSHGGHAVDNVPVRTVAETESTESGQPMTMGLVKKIDKDLGKVTIRHGPIENLGMPQMTMVFRVKDPAMLDRLKEGDQIRFVAEKVDGAFTVMRVEPER
jgi:Cu/Ag efflux protein CusF